MGVRTVTVATNHPDGGMNPLGTCWQIAAEVSDPRPELMDVDKKLPICLACYTHQTGEDACRLMTPAEKQASASMVFALSWPSSTLLSGSWAMPE